MLSHELEQFKLFEGQVQRGTGKVCRVRLGVNDEVACAYHSFLLVFFFSGCFPFDGKTQARIQLGRGGLVRDNIVHLPGGGNSRHAAFIQERDERQLHTCGAQ